MSTEHWDQIYATRPADAVSWFQLEPAMSRRLVESAVPDRTAAIVDVGSGASLLVDRLLDDGYRDLMVLDISTRALDVVRARLGDRAGQVTFVCRDVLEWSPDRSFAVWHDRAVFHFLTDDGERARYVERAAAGVSPGGALIVATFAADGPTHCSGLPVRGHTPDDLAETFAPAFALEASEREAHVTPAGVMQPFSWVVLRRG